MAQSFSDYFEESAKIIRETVGHITEAKMMRAADLCIKAVDSNKVILTCGNGGSAADATHITGEMVVRLEKMRRAFRCVCLSDNSGTITACANDFDYSEVFRRQVEAFGDRDGVLIAISTSGNSPNVVKAAEKAKEMGLSVIAFTGEGGGKLAASADILFDVPAKRTVYIQQAHMCLYHFLCMEIEKLVSA